MPLDVGRVTHLTDQMHRSEDDAGDPIDAGLLLAADGARGHTWTDPSTIGSPLTIEDEGTPLATAATSIDFVGAGVTASGTGAAKTVTIPGGASTLAGLTDVTITTPAEDDTLRHIGGDWVNDNRRWEPVTFDPGTGPEIVFTTTDIVMTWETY